MWRGRDAIDAVTPSTPSPRRAHDIDARAQPTPCGFRQVEGLVADYDLNLGNLKCIIRTFFAEIGITQLRFKPTFNPYTEPSMEVFGYHPDLKKWTEIGNSGIFRPEMLAPMGLPPNVRVIAWGLSLERPTMITHCNWHRRRTTTRSVRAKEPIFDSWDEASP